MLKKLFTFAVAFGLSTTAATLAEASVVAVTSSLAREVSLDKGAGTDLTQRVYDTSGASYANTMWAQESASSRARLLLRFDLSGITPGTIVNSARLRVSAARENANSTWVDVFYMEDSWSSTAATYLTKDGTNAWTGGSILQTHESGTGSATTLIPSDTVNPNMRTGDITLNTARVQAWVNGANNGLGIVGREGLADRGLAIMSSASANPAYTDPGVIAWMGGINANLTRPVLLLDVTVPEPTAIALLLPGGLAMMLRRRRLS